MEESLGRRPLQRRIISDLEAAISQNTLKKQTIEEIFNPSSTDNGYLWTEKKKKEKVNTRTEMRNINIFTIFFYIFPEKSGNMGGGVVIINQNGNGLYFLLFCFYFFLIMSF